ncbi:TPR repeat protein [Legionella geestiana]|uniref:TPR repeat protein n=2 Tax=Legionella geestiana TaxID=45065 RepID=A0A0W0UA25_9GAMM|nr:SEL1-like repeat protein [Legionella geestiana]KTD04818.1 TPR repeat protein [Legionella geestiana]STX53997.1 TPR repeat protein [Legionella geestiana]
MPNHDNTSHGKRALMQAIIGRLREYAGGFFVFRNKEVNALIEKYQGAENQNYLQLVGELARISDGRDGRFSRARSDITKMVSDYMGSLGAAHSSSQKTVSLSASSSGLIQASSLSFLEPESDVSFLFGSDKAAIVTRIAEDILAGDWRQYNNLIGIARAFRIETWDATSGLMELCETLMVGENPSSHAMVLAGAFYHEGSLNVPKDYARAKLRYDFAAALGHAGAMLNLGLMYERGEGVTKNLDSAREYYERAVALGNAGATLNLGLMYARGEGVTKNLDSAREYYEQAAALGNAGAMLNLGYMYERGEGVTKNLDSARGYYERAAALGNVCAMLDLGLMYERGEGVTKNLDSARGYYERAAALGNVYAIFNLGYMNELGEGVKQNFARAIKHYEEAAALGHPGAMLNLGLMYMRGQGVTKNFVLARRYFEKAALYGDADAMLNLGYLYEYGLGMKKCNFDRARRYYEEAAALGHAGAMLKLGLMYAHGQGVTKNFLLAKRHFEKAALYRDTRAMLNLGYLYEHGLGVKCNFDRARRYYEEAAALGHAGAKKVIERLTEAQRQEDLKKPLGEGVVALVAQFFHDKFQVTPTEVTGIHGDVSVKVSIPPGKMEVLRGIFQEVGACIAFSAEIIDADLMLTITRVSYQDYCGLVQKNPVVDGLSLTASSGEDDAGRHGRPEDETCQEAAGTRVDDTWDAQKGAPAQTAGASSSFHTLFGQRGGGGSNTAAKRGPEHETLWTTRQG